MNTAQQAIDTLKRHWGYDSFRPLQLDIITSLMEGNDTLGLLPTGGGKSITFQVPALMGEGLTVVITPLVSLMKDQVDNLRDRGIDARFLHAGMTMRESRLALDRCRHGRAKLLYLSPEKLQGERFMDELRHMPVSRIVVDEAHCISQWGYDFRPAYLKIGELRKAFPDAPVLALTASATPEVAEDIMTQLRFGTRCVFARSFARDNLSYIVRYEENKERKLLEVLTRTAGCAIVYVRSRKRTRELAEVLTRYGVSADFYHAGLAVEEKNERQNRWKSGECRVMVATNAFGMGIDKPDVRYVVHYDLPPSLEEYYQEAGRAGRDGKPAYAVVIASQADKGLMTRRLNEAFPAKEYVARIYEMACVFLGVAVEEGYGHMYEFDFVLFCDRFKLNPRQARSALMLLTRAGYFEYIDEIATRSHVMVIAEKQELYDLRLDEQADRVFQLLLRSYTGLFADYVNIDEGLLARRLNLTESQVYESLLAIQREHAIHYIPKRRTPYIYFTTSREDTRYIRLPRVVYEDQRERMKKRMEAMKRFVFNTTDGCRVAGMLRYFGEKNPAPCGHCDICRDARPAPEVRNLDERLAQWIAQRGGHAAIDDILASGLAPRTQLIEALRRLIDRGHTIDGAN